MSVSDWLGTGKITNQEKAKNWPAGKKAGPIYKKLAKQYSLKNRSDWTKFARSHKDLLEKLNIPSEPWAVYTQERVWRKMKDE